MSGYNNDYSIDGYPICLICHKEIIKEIQNCVVENGYLYHNDCIGFEESDDILNFDLF